MVMQAVSVMNCQKIPAVVLPNILRVLISFERLAFCAVAMLIKFTQAMIRMMRPTKVSVVMSDFEITPPYLASKCISFNGCK